MANFIIDYEGFHKNQILKTELEEYKEEINGAIDKAKDKVDVDMANGKYTGARLENYQEISDIFKEMKCFINNSLSYDLDGMEPEQDFDPMRTNRSVTFTQVNAAAEVGDSNDDGLYVKESPARPKST
ncbi:MAG: hypothetical protein HOI53_03205 [Francisellaceae bacterium]|nr:hypothetical protein [Francisellaceae bacterium]